MMYVIDVMFNVNGLYMFMMYNDVIGYCDDPIGLKKPPETPIHWCEPLSPRNGPASGY